MIKKLWRSPIVIATSASLLSFIYYLLDPRRPTAPALGSGWWTFSDQGRYLVSVEALSRGVLDPASHWYLPGYSLLGLWFVNLTTANPFLIPDLLLLWVAVLLISAIAAHLAPGWRQAGSAAALAFCASLVSVRNLDAWVTPWTTTPQVVLVLTALLCTLKFSACPTRLQPLLWAGSSSAAIAAFRPVDAVLAIIAITLLCGIRLWESSVGIASGARAVLSFGVGVCLAILPLGSLYVLINGWHLSPYLALSALIGFEWRLIPVRFVTIVLSPQPLFPTGFGLIVAFPWIAPGMVGMIACITAPPLGSTRLGHTLVAGVAIAHLVLYLSYRDLHPQGLWLNYNYHYFKLFLVVTALYCALLVPLFLEGKRRSILLGLALLIMLLPLRAELGDEQALSPPVSSTSGSVVRLPSVSLGVRDTVLIPGFGSFEAVYDHQHNLYVGDHEEKWYSSTADFKTFPTPSGLLITPLRPFQRGPIAIYFDPSIIVLPRPVRLSRQKIVFGVPCWIPGWRCGT